MARKTAEVTISEEGRDTGKIFLLTEMPASQAEKWATRAFLALARAGVEVPDDIAQAGMAGLAMMGFKMLGGISFADAEPLMDEMFRCIQIKPDRSNPAVIRGLIEDDIEEVRTRFNLRMEVLALHMGFSSAADLLSSLREKEPSVDSKTTGTSPRSSAPSSQAAKQRFMNSTRPSP